MLGRQESPVDDRWKTLVLFLALALVWCVTLGKSLINNLFGLQFTLLQNGDNDVDAPL